jgi:hypothetical protein
VDELYIWPEWNTVECSSDFVLKGFECGSVSIPCADELFDEFCTAWTYEDVELIEWRQKDVPHENRSLHILNYFNQVHTPANVI